MRRDWVRVTSPYPRSGFGTRDMRMMRSDIHHTTQPPPRLLGEEREGRQYGERDERGVREKERKGKYKLDGYGFLVSPNLYRASLPFSLQRNRGGGTSLYKKIEENSRVSPFWAFLQVGFFFKTKEIYGLGLGMLHNQCWRFNESNR